jgi:GNAT superfamily N-acetyltransferase
LIRRRLACRFFKTCFMTTREFRPGDEPFLLQMLMEAAYFPSEERPTIDKARIEPRIRQWLDDFGVISGDIGVIALERNIQIGAAWCRLFNPENIVGQVGYLSNDIPAIAIGVVPEKRSRGVGSAILTELALTVSKSGYKGLSLCAGESNPAVRFYTRHGFEAVRRDKNLLIMQKSLIPPPTQ